MNILAKSSVQNWLAASAVAAALIVLLPASSPAQGQGKGKADPAAKGPNPNVVHAPIPRAADGKPDLTGTWQSGGVSINGEAGAPPLHPLPPIDTHTIRREPLVYKPAFEAKRKGLDPAVDDPTLYCLLPGVPRISTMPMPIEIVQTPKEVVFLYEAFRAWRRVPIHADLKHPDDLVPTWMGDSVGRWEGDTLVIDVTGFNDKSWIAGAASIHTEAMHTTERYTLNNDGSLTMEAMVEDKDALEKPYYTGATFRRPIDVRVEEYECAENNPDPEHMKKALGRK
ncbi:MAG: hypothetical protein ABI824_00905 [Acidobacteriota bacterium]